MSENERSAIDEANRLYWDSDASVAAIAQQLGWSRRALYEAIEPLPIEAACDVCGTPLVYTNRSARASAAATCAVCTSRETAASPAESTELERALRAEARDRRERAYAAGAAAVVGASVAAAFTLLVVRRR